MNPNDTIYFAVFSKNSKSIMQGLYFVLASYLLFSSCQPSSPSSLSDEEAAWLSVVDPRVEKASRIAAFWTLNDRYNRTNKDSIQLLLDHLVPSDEQPADTLSQAFFHFQRIKNHESTSDTLSSYIVSQATQWLIDHYEDYQVPDILAVAHLNLLWSYEQETQYTTAAEFIKEQQNKWALFSPFLEGRIREKAVTLFMENGDYANAILQLKQAIWLSDSTKNLYYTASLYTYLGDIFSRLDLPDLATASHKEALANFINIPENQQIEDHNNYVIEQKILTASSSEEALSYYQEGKTKTEKMRPQDHSTCLEFCLWTYYYHNGEYSNAEKYLQLIIDSKEANNKVGADIERSKMLRILNKQGNYAEAIAIGTQIEAPLVRVGSREALQRLYLQLRIAYDGVNQLDSAYHYLQLSEDLNEFLLEDKEVATQLVKLIDEFNQNQAQSIQQQAQLKIEAKLAQQRTLLWSTILILLLIASVLVSLWRNFTVKKRNNALLQQQNEALEQSNRRLDRFAEGVSHDILSNLNLILSTGQVLVDKDSEKRDGYISFYEQSMTTTRELKRYSLELLRSAKQDTLTEKKSDPTIVINGILEQQQFALKKYAIRTRIDLPALPLPMSSGDLAQIFQNLIENAIRYLQEVPDPQIVITAKTQQDQLAIGVIDNGRGVDEELLETIFTPTSTYSDQGELHGKGLALVQTIVAENGGKVWAENNEWGGLSVWFTLAGL